MSDQPNQVEASDPLPIMESAPAAWQPFTPRGVAAFASASFARLFLMELIVGLLAAGAAVWFLSTAWFPAVREAIRHLPEKGTIVWGELNWPDHAFEVLHERRPFLNFVVDLDNLSRGNSGADLSFRFHKRNAEICSPFGSFVYPYPKDYQIEFNRLELEPGWEAWRPMLLGWTALLTPVLLMLIWSLLATIYFGAAWLIGFFANRDLSWGGSWRLCSAALMPGALTLSAAIMLYGLAVLDLFHVLLVTGLHFIVGWIYFITATLQLPKVSTTIKTKGNPFSASSQADKQKANPFAGSNPFAAAENSENSDRDHV